MYIWNLNVKNLKLLQKRCLFTKQLFCNFNFFDFSPHLTVYRVCSANFPFYNFLLLLLFSNFQCLFFTFVIWFFISLKMILILRIPSNFSFQTDRFSCESSLAFSVGLKSGEDLKLLENPAWARIFTGASELPSDLHLSQLKQSGPLAKTGKKS